MPSLTAPVFVPLLALPYYPLHEFPRDYGIGKTQAP
jgi:hypothetical protein